jgi:hypothetical protein
MLPESSDPRQAFIDAAEPVEITIAQKGKIIQRVYASPRIFTSKSVGWNANGKIDMPVADERHTCQLGVNLTVAHSKEW